MDFCSRKRSAMSTFQVQLSQELCIPIAMKNFVIQALPPHLEFSRRKSFPYFQSLFTLHDSYPNTNQSSINFLHLQAF